jgi:hypothetical protein
LDSAIIAVNKAGRPTKYEPETVGCLLAAIADGLNIKQACLATGICENTLGSWRDKHPELELQLEQAREAARQNALAGIKKAGEAGDWRALEAFLRMSYPADYRRDTNINVAASATAQQATQIITEEQRLRIIKEREQLLRTTQQRPLPQQSTSADN